MTRRDVETEYCGCAILDLGEFQVLPTHGRRFYLIIVGRGSDETGDHIGTTTRGEGLRNRRKNKGARLRSGQSVALVGKHRRHRDDQGDARPRGYAAEECTEPISDAN